MNGEEEGWEDETKGLEAEELGFAAEPKENPEEDDEEFGAKENVVGVEDDDDENEGKEEEAGERKGDGEEEGVGFEKEKGEDCEEAEEESDEKREVEDEDDEEAVFVENEKPEGPAMASLPGDESVFRGFLREDLKWGRLRSRGRSRPGVTYPVRDLRVFLPIKLKIVILPSLCQVQGSFSQIVMVIPPPPPSSLN